MQKIAGIVLVVGAILFIAAAFSPIAMTFFPEQDPARRMEIVREGRRAWTVTQILFTSGAAVAAIGVDLAAYQWRTTPGSWLAYLGAAAFVVGAGLWVWHVYLRAVEPQAFVTGAVPGWHFIVYTFLTQAGMIMIGIVLLRTAVPNWVGWMLIGGAVFFFVVYLVMKDMPPFAYYILLLLRRVHDLSRRLTVRRVRPRAPSFRRR